MQPKPLLSTQAAVDLIPDGAVIMAGGFGMTGNPGPLPEHSCRNRNPRSQPRRQAVTGGMRALATEGTRKYLERCEPKMVKIVPGKLVAIVG